MKCSSTTTHYIVCGHETGDMTTQTRTTRLAPSPTGGLHLGNARSFLLNWAIGRREGWSVRLRMDDLETERCSAEAEEAALVALEWLGMDHDGPIIRQTATFASHRAALEKLSEAGLIFACDRSRRELRAAAEALGAPHESGSNLVSTPGMRPEDPAAWCLRTGDVNHRLALEPGEEHVEDALSGTRCFDPLTCFGDPILWTRRDTAAYHLASVVDDLEAGVTDVIRGEDLMPSAALHQRLCRLLGGEAPRWWHLPLVLDHEGRRLAKRDGDLTLTALRARGVPAPRVVGLIAWSCGVQDTRTPMTAAEFVQALDVDALTEWARAESREGGYRLLPEDLDWLERRTT
jgi:glutamyl-tRNA synthetase